MSILSDRIEKLWVVPWGVAGSTVVTRSIGKSTSYPLPFLINFLGSALMCILVHIHNVQYSPSLVPRGIETKISNKANYKKNGTKS